MEKKVEVVKLEDLQFGDGYEKAMAFLDEIEEDIRRAYTPVLPPVEEPGALNMRMSELQPNAFRTYAQREVVDP